jgi:hypothetical protein
VTRPRHHPQSLESEQTPKLLERLADKCGVPVSSRPILDTVKARTPDHTLPLAARSKLFAEGLKFERDRWLAPMVAVIAAVASILNLLKCEP